MINQKLQAWIDLMRSTDLGQTQGALCRVEEDSTRSYCCLGIAPLALGDAFDLPDSLGFVSFNGNGQTLSSPYFDELGLPKRVEPMALSESITKVIKECENAKEWIESGSNLPVPTQSVLATLNDSGQWPFKRIAQVVESLALTGKADDAGWDQ